MSAEIERFAHMSSAIHRWDPRWKIAGLSACIVVIGLERPEFRESPSYLRDVPPAAAGLLLALVVVALSSLPAGFVLRRIRGPLGILLMLFATLAIAYPGPRRGLAWLSVSSDGCVIASAVTLRALSIVLLAVAAFGTARFDVTLKALRALRVPSRLVQVLLFTYRYLSAYADQLRRMSTAMRARGFRPALDRRTLKTFGSSLGVLLVGSIDRSERIHAAMLSRGFQGEFRALEGFSTRWADVGLFLACIVAGAGLLAWRIL